MVMERLKNYKDIENYRKKLLIEQKCVDPIINCNIIKPVLDHDHESPYKCRAVLQNEVNLFLGKCENAYKRYLKHLTNKSLVEVLENTILYLKTDYSKRPTHSTAVKSEVRVFRRLNAFRQIFVLEKLNIPPKSTAKGRIKQVKKLLVQGVIDVKKLTELCEAFSK